MNEFDRNRASLIKMIQLLFLFMNFSLEKLFLIFNKLFNKNLTQTSFCLFIYLLISFLNKNFYYYFTKLYKSNLRLIMRFVKKAGQ